MPARLGLFGALLLLLPVVYLAVKTSAALRSRRVLAGAYEPSLSAGRRTVVFFTGEYCTICKYQQKPALESVRDDVGGDLRIVEVDASREPDLVKRFSVLSLPTTVVLAPDGRVGAVNYGFAPRERLRAQVTEPY